MFTSLNSEDAMSELMRFRRSSLLVATVLLGLAVTISASDWTEVDKRGGARLFQNVGPEGEKRGGGRLFGGSFNANDKRGGARMFAPSDLEEDKRGGGRAFGASLLGEKRGGARVFVSQKRGGGRGFQLMPTKKFFSEWYLMQDPADVVAAEKKRAGGRTFPVSGDDSKEKRAWEEMERYLP